ncbi:MAG: sugar ABC transporter permease [Clostridia bacterium]|nr:sugar ABC transporter permease [Clostridia bacterium]
MYRTKKVWLFLFPGLLALMIFYFIPFVGGIRYSVLDGSFSNRFVGFENYRKLWSNSMFLLGLRNTFELSLICAPLLWLLSYLTASGLARIYPKGIFVRSSVLLPFLAPSSAVILVWQVFFDYGGPLNRLLTALGGERILWLNSGAMRLPIIIMFLWKNLGLCTVIFLSAIRSIPASYYEAAELDGIRPFRRTMNITLPMIMPSSYLVFILAWINAFRIFREVYFLSGSYPDLTVYTLQHYMNNVYGKLDYQLVTSAAYSFAVLVLLIFGILFLLQQRAANEING